MTPVSKLSVPERAAIAALSALSGAEPAVGDDLLKGWSPSSLPNTWSSVNDFRPPGTTTASSNFSTAHSSHPSARETAYTVGGNVSFAVSPQTSTSTGAPNSTSYSTFTSSIRRGHGPSPLVPLAEPEKKRRPGWKKDFEEELLEKDARIIAGLPPPKPRWHFRVTPCISHKKPKEAKADGGTNGNMRQLQLVIKLDPVYVSWDQEQHRSVPTFRPEKIFSVEATRISKSKDFEDCFPYRGGEGGRIHTFDAYVEDIGLDDTEKEQLLRQIKAESLTFYDQCKDEEGKKHQSDILDQQSFPSAEEDLITES